MIIISTRSDRRMGNWTLLSRLVIDTQPKVKTKPTPKVHFQDHKQYFGKVAISIPI